MEIKKSTLYLGIIVLTLVFGGIFLLKADGNSGATSNVISESGQVLQEDVQRVIIGEKNGNYYPNEIKVKANQPISVTLDKSVVGCFRSFNIKDLGVSKYVRTPQETIDFTPTRKGTFTFACSMGMGYGKIIVE